MSIDYDSLLDEIYDRMGIAADFVSCADVSVTLKVIDKTEGIEIPQGAMMLQASKPAVCVRVSELIENELSRTLVSGGKLTFNEASWRVEATRPKPKPGSKGELYLLLQEWCDD